MRLLNVDDWRRAAGARLPRVVRDFVEEGAEDNLTLRANRTAFSDFCLMPRTLVDVSGCSPEVDVFGRRYSQPFGISPIGGACLLYPDADILMARAARRANVPFILSTHSFVPVARVVQEARVAPWFQLYLTNDRAVNENAVGMAREAGCEVLVLTVDVPVGGNREHNRRNGFSVPVRVGLRQALDGLRHPGWLLRVFARLKLDGGLPAHLVDWGARRDTANWSDVDWLRRAWPGKLVIKGILTARDARIAIDRGADGIFISNHGGRQLDGAPATIRVLPEIAAAVRGRTAIFIDSGFRRGSDVVKALALGADMAFVGRPAAYGVAVAGETGVSEVLRILGKEVERVMALLGCCATAELDRRFIAGARGPVPTPRRYTARREGTALEHVPHDPAARMPCRPFLPTIFSAER